MTQGDQFRLVIDLTNNVKSEILEKLGTDKIPEIWDGVELRWYIADKFSEVVFGDFTKKHLRKRAKDYENIYLINNL